MKYILCVYLLLLSGSIFSQTISTIAGTGTAGYSGDSGPATFARINYASAVISDAASNLYFPDMNNNCVRKISTSGIITTIAGSSSGIAGFSGDGGPATLAKLNTPYDIAFDDTGNLYIADGYNHRIRKINSSGIISTFAGTGSPGFSGDGLAATLAKFWNPFYVCTDHYGNVYVSDNQNQRVRKINVAGIVSTVIGNSVSGDSGDGGIGTLAEISYPGGIKVDSSKNLYIAEYSNRIRKVDSFGIVSTIIGVGPVGFSGDGGPATAAYLHQPIGFVLDPMGNMIFTDVQNQRVRKVDVATGIITTIAGNGIAGYSGDGMNATAAELNFPPSLCLDNSQNLIIADGQNFRIRKVTFTNNHLPHFTGGHSQSLAVCEGSTATPLNTYLAVSDSDAGQTEVWSVVLNPAHGVLVAGYSTTSTGGVLTPSGLTYTPFPGYTGNDSFKVKVTDGIAADTTAIFVTINPSAILSPIMGPDTICIPGETITTYTESISGGTWSMTNAHGAIAVTGGVSGYTTGADTVVYSYSGACGVGIVTKPIYLQAVPLDSPIYGSSTVCIGETITLTDASTGGNWWHTNDHSVIEADGVDAGVAPGGYDTITYSIINSCGASVVTHVVQVYTAWQCDSVLAVSPITASSCIVSLSPNPAHNSLHLEWNNPAKTELQIINQIGQILLSTHTDKTNMEIDIRQLPAGLYMVRTTQDGNRWTGRFVKE